MDEVDAASAEYRGDVEHSISFAHTEHDYFVSRKADLLVDIAARHLGDPHELTVLDVGCGPGLTDAFLSSRLGALHGVDIAADVVAAATEHNPDVTYAVQEGATLPYDDDVFDVTFAICVAHHVEPPDRAAFVADVHRVTRPGGLVVMFEHNPYNPLTRLAVSRCELDEDVELLSRREVTGLLSTAGFDVLETEYFLFSTIDRPWALRAERLLRRVPLGAQHVAVGRRPRT